MGEILQGKADREDKSKYNLSKTKDIRARDNEERIPEHKHKESETIDHLAEETIWRNAAVVTRNCRGGMVNVLGVRGGGGAEMIFGRSKQAYAS